jgi:hypothetical protein
MFFRKNEWSRCFSKRARVTLDIEKKNVRRYLRRKKMRDSWAEREGLRFMKKERVGIPKKGKKSWVVSEEKKKTIGITRKNLPVLRY